MAEVSNNAKSKVIEPPPPLSYPPQESCGLLEHRKVISFSCFIVADGIGMHDFAQHVYRTFIFVGGCAMPSPFSFFFLSINK